MSTAQYINTPWYYKTAAQAEHEQRVKTAAFGKLRSLLGSRLSGAVNYARNKLIPTLRYNIADRGMSLASDPLAQARISMGDPGAFLSPVLSGTARTFKDLTKDFALANPSSRTARAFKNTAEELEMFDRARSMATKTTIPMYRGSEVVASGLQNALNSLF